MGALLASLIPTIIKEVINGKKDEIGNKITKGLVRSKTANYQHLKVVSAIFAVLALSLPKPYEYGAIAIIVGDWVIGLYLRIKTKDAV